MQDTSHQLFTESVTDEILLSMDDEDETVVEQILEQFDLLDIKTGTRFLFPAGRSSE